MRRLLTILCLSLFACRKESGAQGGPDRGPLPGPERARDAAARVKPALENELEAKNLRFGDPVFLRAFKEERELELWVLRRDTGKFEHFRTWPVAASSGNPGPKLAEGDGQVPEGFYFAGPKAMKPDSRYHLAFNVGYPNAYDQYHRRTGSFIMIHGGNASIGCLAMTDAGIEEIYTLCDAALRSGQPFFRVHIFPFRMSEARMADATGHEWEDFWHNLREGYEHFERDGIPPEVTVENGRYRFSQPIGR